MSTSPTPSSKLPTLWMRIVRGSLSGDRQHALGRLYDYLQSLSEVSRATDRAAEALWNRPIDAEDLFQDAFLELMTQEQRFPFRDRYELRRALLLVLRHNTIDLMRRRANRLQRLPGDHPIADEAERRRREVDELFAELHEGLDLLQAEERAKPENQLVPGDPTTAQTPLADAFEARHYAELRVVVGEGGVRFERRETLDKRVTIQVMATILGVPFAQAYTRYRLAMEWFEQWRRRGGVQ